MACQSPAIRRDSLNANILVEPETSAVGKLKRELTLEALFALTKGLGEDLIALPLH